MAKIHALGVVLLLAGSELAWGQAIFAGTWRPDPQRPDPSAPPDVIELTGGVYTCLSCKPSYSVKADGSDQPVPNNPRFDTLSISVPDEHTVLKTAKKGSVPVLKSRTVLAPDGKTKTEVQTIDGVAPHAVDMAIRSSRVAAGAAGSHPISGSWRVIEADLVHHEEDTTYRVNGNVLTMNDGLGRSFTARLDGTEAPYKGDPRFTTVVVRLIDARTLEETDKKGTQTVLITRWSVDADGKTMHARFDNTHGSVQEQTGHRVR